MLPIKRTLIADEKISPGDLVIVSEKRAKRLPRYNLGERVLRLIGRRFYKIGFRLSHYHDRIPNGIATSKASKGDLVKVLPYGVTAWAESDINEIAVAFDEIERASKGGEK